VKKVRASKTERRKEGCCSVRGRGEEASGGGEKCRLGGRSGNEFRRAKGGRDLDSTKVWAGGTYRIEKEKKGGKNRVTTGGGINVWRGAHSFYRKEKTSREKKRKEMGCNRRRRFIKNWQKIGRKERTRRQGKRKEVERSLNDKTDVFLRFYQARRQRKKNLS